MPDIVPQYYWDACLFLEHLRKEPVNPGRRRAVLRLLEENKSHENKIFTSVITHLEAIPKKLVASYESMEAEYWGYFNGMWLLDIDVSKPILNLAREIKDYYYEEGDAETGKPYRLMSTGDAIHLATAIVWEADEFHTRDGNRKGGNIPLIGLPEASPNGKIAGRWSLTIVCPDDGQGNLLDSLA